MARYSDSSLQQYKTFNRRRRTMYTEEPFSYGMQYVTSPINTGAVKNIINIDLALDGEALTPRDGIRAFEVTQSPISECDVFKTDKLLNKELLHAAEITEEDNFNYKQLVLSEIYDDVLTLPNNKIACRSKLVTGLPEEQSKYNVSNMADESVTTLLQHNSQDYYLHCINPELTEIHDVPIDNKALLTNLISTSLTIDNSTKMYCFIHSLTGFVQDGVNYQAGDHLMFTKFDTATKTYHLEKLLPYEATANDAINSMYNMLADDPYSFSNKATLGTIQLMGLYPVDRETGKAVPMYYTYKNNRYRLKVQYNSIVGAGAPKYLIKWSWSTGASSNFDLVKEQIIDMSQYDTPPDIYLDWTSNTTSCIFRIEVFKWETFDQYNPSTQQIDSITGFNTIACSVLPVMLTFADDLSDSAKMLDYVKYDLTTAVGMCSWRQRLVLWGPEKGAQALFISEANNPAWFPFPMGLCAFPDKVIKAVPYLDNLLVFTTTAVYLITLASDGNSWTQACLQSNLHITDADGAFIKSIKNMVFYKSNNYFYMIVPSASSANGLTVAPITANIENLLDNFPQAVEEALLDLYDRNITVYKDVESSLNKDYIKLISFQNYVDYKKVYNVYTFKDLDNRFLNYYLIYDTSVRAWASYILESQTLIKPYKLDVAGFNVYAAYVPVKLIDANGSYVSHSVQFLKRDEKNIKDFYIYPYQTPEQYGLERFKLENLCYDNTKYPNYQFIDSGAREQESDIKKRYREIQMQLNNIEQTPMHFNTTFFIDGHSRQDDFTYETREYLNPEAGNYGSIRYSRIDDIPFKGQFVPGTTELGDTLELDSEEDIVSPTTWEMNISRLPNTNYWKIRVPVSGKGYTPQVKIVTKDQVKYELMNITWVYRILYAR